MIRDLLGGNVVNAVVSPDGRDWSIAVGTQVGLDPTNNGCSCTDWVR
jgi:hypothetical protein